MGKKRSKESYTSNDGVDDSEAKLKLKNKKIQKKKSSEKKGVDDSETKLKSKKNKKIQKKKSSEKKGVDDSETKLKSKKNKMEKSSEKKGEKKLTRSIGKCSQGLKKIQTDTDLRENSLKEKETPKKKLECGFSVPEADGYNWGNNSRTIYVKGFDSSLPRDVIKIALGKHFGSCGEVRRVFVPIECETGARLGFAFINLKDKNDIKKALELNGSDLGGSKLEVMMAIDRKDFYSYPYPNSKGCGACSVRDQRMRIYKLHYATAGGISKGFFRKLSQRTWPDPYKCSLLSR